MLRKRRTILLVNLRMHRRQILQRREPLAGRNNRVVIRDLLIVRIAGFRDILVKPFCQDCIRVIPAQRILPSDHRYSSRSPSRPPWKAHGRPFADTSPASSRTVPARPSASHPGLASASWNSHSEAPPGYKAAADSSSPSFFSMLSHAPAVTGSGCESSFTRASA